MSTENNFLKKDKVVANHNASITGLPQKYNVKLSAKANRLVTDMSSGHCFLLSSTSSKHQRQKKKLSCL